MAAANVDRQAFTRFPRAFARGPLSIVLAATGKKVAEGAVRAT
jgi:hypothetical protein